MFPRTVGAVSAVLCAVAAYGCDSPEQQRRPTTPDALAAPLFSSAADFDDVQVAAVDLCPAGFTSTVDFSESDQMFGVSVRVATDGAAHFETSGDPTLDTRLFVFGPADESGFYGELPVFGGDGLHSSIDETLTAGVWFVVVTTAEGSGVGEVTLSASGACGSDSDGDRDDDGVPDASDNCPYVPNPDQDPEACGECMVDAVPCEVTVPSGELCSGYCRDGVCKPADNCLDDGGDGDRDDDGVPDASDNCPYVPNPDQDPEACGECMVDAVTCEVTMPSGQTCRGLCWDGVCSPADNCGD